MEDIWREGLANVIDFVPKLLLALVIIIVGILVAKLLSRGLSALLERVGFDRAIERGGIRRALAGSSLDASDIVAKIVYYTLVLFVLQFAFGVFGPNPVSDLLEGIIAFLPRLIVAIIIIIISAAIAAGAKTLIGNTLGALPYGRLLANIVSIFILFLGISAALTQINVAEAVILPLLVTVLAIIAGVIIVGAGGGLIKPMQARWEAYLTRAEAEAPRIKEEAEASMADQDMAATKTLPRDLNTPRNLNNPRRGATPVDPDTETLM